MQGGVTGERSIHACVTGSSGIREGVGDEERKGWGDDESEEKGKEEGDDEIVEEDWADELPRHTTPAASACARPHTSEVCVAGATKAALKETT